MSTTIQPSQKITPFLWFDGRADEAMNFYVSAFKNSEIKNLMRNGDQVFSGTFQLEGQEFMALNGGPMFKFTPAISLFVSCDSQQEVDELWGKLTADGGMEQQCGWLVDKFGVSWQIVPTILGELLWNSDPAKSQKAMQAMMKMKKLDIAALKAAAEAA